MGIFCRNENDTSLFLRKPSTYWVTLVRLILITVPYILLHTNEKIGKCIYNSSLLSVLLRPHVTLAHMEEAHAISHLSKSSDYFSSFYSTSDSIRIPPLMLFLLSPFQTPDAGLWLSILLLLVDFLISYLLEQIGIQFVSRSHIFSDISNTSLNLRPLEEDDLQRKLPDEIRPQNEHIFPIYKSDLDSSSKSTEEQLSEENKTVRPLINMRDIPLISAQLYYWSPFTFLPTGLWHCFQNIPSLFLVASFYESLSGSLSMTSFYIAVAVYMEPHHIMYLVPIILVINVGNIGQSSTTTTTTMTAQKKQNIVSSSYAAAVVVVLFTLWSLCLQGISYHLLGSIHYWKALRSVYGTTWLTNGPNLSLQWYFRMQIFSRFRHYFGAMFALFPFVLVGPIYLRFIRYPEVQVRMHEFLKRKSVCCRIMLFE